MPCGYLEIYITVPPATFTPSNAVALPQVRQSLCPGWLIIRGEHHGTLLTYLLNFPQLW